MRIWRGRITWRPGQELHHKGHTFGIRGRAHAACGEGSEEISTMPWRVSPAAHHRLCKGLDPLTSGQILAISVSWPEWVLCEARIGPVMAEGRFSGSHANSSSLRYPRQTRIPEQGFATPTAPKSVALFKDAPRLIATENTTRWSNHWLCWRCSTSASRLGRCMLRRLWSCHLRPSGAQKAFSAPFSCVMQLRTKITRMRGRGNLDGHAVQLRAASCGVVCTLEPW